MKYKSAKSLKVNRLKLLFILLPIMAIAFYALAFMMGGSASVFVPSEVVEHVSDMKEPPMSGSPTDYTPMENWAFANWRIYNASYFEATSDGTAKADIGIAKYSQNVHNYRKIKDKAVFTETVSVSALVKNAEQMFISEDDAVAYRTSASISGNTVTWSDEIFPMSTSTYFARYGSVPREITKYSITTESVTSAKLVSVGGGKYTYEFVVDPEIGGKYFKNEIATRAGSAQPAEMISMKLTVTMDENWYVLTTHSVDSYKVAIPGLGRLVTTSEMNDVFSYINEDRDMPERELFEPYLPKVGDTVTDVPMPEEKNASTYLSEAFAPYMAGEPLKIKASIDALGYNHALDLSLNMSTMEVDALIDDALYVGYDGSNAYVEAGAISGYLPISALSELDFNAFSGGGDLFGNLSGLLGIDAELLTSLKGMDLKAQLSDDILGAVFENSTFEVKNGIAVIGLNFKLSDLLTPESEFTELAQKLKLKVNMRISDGETLDLLGIDAVVNFSGLPINVTVVPSEDLSFPDKTAMPSLEPLLDFIEPITNTINSAAFKLNLNAKVESGDYSGTINAAITINRDLTLEGDITLDDPKVKAHIAYDGKTAYISCGNLRLKVDASDISEVVEKVTALFGIDLDDSELALPSLSPEDMSTDVLLSMILESDISELLSHIGEFEVSDGKLRVVAVIDGASYGIELTHNGEYLSTLYLDTLTFGDTAIDLSATLDILDSEKEINIDGEFVDIGELIELLPPILSATKADSYEIDFALSLDELELLGSLAIVKTESGVDGAVTLSALGADVTITYHSGNLYLECGSIKIKASSADIEKAKDLIFELISSIGEGEETNKELLDKIAEMLPASDTLDIESLLETVLSGMTMKDGVLTATLTFGGYTFDISLGTSAAVPLKAALVTEVGGKSLKADLSLIGLNTLSGIALPSGEFTELSDIEKIAKAAKDTASDYGFYELDLKIAVNDIDIAAVVGFNRDFKAARVSISLEKYGFDADLTFVDSCVYISALGLNLKADKSDIEYIGGVIYSLLPESAKDKAEQITALIEQIASGDTEVIKGLIEKYLPSGADMPDLSDIDLGAVIGKLTYLHADESGAVAIIDGTTITLKVEGGVISALIVEADNLALDLKLKVKESAEVITVPEANYSSLKDIVDLALDTAATVQKTAYELKAQIAIDEVKLDVTLKLNRDLSVIAANLYLPDLGMSADVTVYNSAIYISALGIDVKATPEGLNALQKELLPLLPQEYEGTVNLAFAAVKVLLQNNNDQPLSLTSLLDSMEKEILPLMSGKSKEQAETITSAIRAALNKDFAAAMDLLKKDDNQESKDINLGELTESFSLDFTENGMSLGLGEISAELTRKDGVLESLTVNGIEGLGLSLTLKTYDEKIVSDIDEQATEYIDLEKLTRFISPVAELIEKNTFVIGFTADIDIDGNAIAVDGQLELIITEDGVKFQVTLLLDQNEGDAIRVVFALDGSDYYIVYDDVAIHATSDDLTRIKEVTEKYLPAFLPKLIKEITGKFTSGTANFDIKSMLGMLERAYMPTDDSLAVELNLFDMPIKAVVTLSTDSSGADFIENVELSININGEITAWVGVNAKLLESGSDAATKVLSVTGETFTEGSDLIGYAEALISSLDQEGYDVTLDYIEVNYPAQNRTDYVSGHIAFIPTGKGIPNLVADIYVKQVRGEAIKELTFDIMITDGDPLQEIYLTYNGVNFKLTIDELLYLIGAVKDVLDIPNGTLLDKLVPEDREVVSGAFLDDFNISALTDIGEMAGEAFLLLTEVVEEAQDFMNNPDYDYTKIAETLNRVISTVTSLIGIEDGISMPSADSILDMLKSLPRVSLESNVDDSATASTMTVVVDGTEFYLTRTLGGKPYLSNWSMVGLKSDETYGDFSVTMYCPDSSTDEGAAAIESMKAAVERPKYHDYNYATSQGGTYKKQELTDKILAGQFPGVSIPYADYGYINYYETFEESNIIAGYRYNKAIFSSKYTQSDSGSYVKVRTGDNSYDYVSISPLLGTSFVTHMNNEDYVVVYKGTPPTDELTVDNVEYWSKSYYNSCKNILIDNGTQTTFDDYFAKWFSDNFGMSVGDYTAKYLDGHMLNDLSDAVPLITAFLNTANLKDFHITGNINVNIVGIIKTNIPIDVRIKIVNGKPLVVINIQTDSVALGTLQKSASQIYYYDGYLTFVKLDKDKKYNYVRVTTEQFFADMSDTDTMMKYIYFIVPLSSTVQNMITIDGNNQNEPGVFEDFFGGYYHKNGGHYISLDLGKLTGDTKSFSNLDLTIGTQQKNVGEYAKSVFGEDETIFGDTTRTFVSTIYAKTKLVNAVEMTVTANMMIGETVDEFRIPTYSGNNIVYNESNFIGIYDLPEYLTKIDEFIASSGHAGTINDVPQRSSDVWIG